MTIAIITTVKGVWEVKMTMILTMAIHSKWPIPIPILTITITDDDGSDDDIYVVEVRNDTRVDLEKKLRQASKRREDLLLKATHRQEENTLRSSSAGRSSVGASTGNADHGAHINVNSSNTNNDGWFQSKRKNKKVDESNSSSYTRSTAGTHTFRSMSVSSTDTTSGRRGPVKSKKYPKRHFGFLDQESALKEQDRLLRESADRLQRQYKKKEQQQQKQRSNGSATASSLSSSLGAHDYIVTIAVEDVTQLPSNHWKWKNPWCRLGLPPRSSYGTVKKNYRKLSLLYHPDKAKFDDSINRFQAIKEAYEIITEQLGK